MSRLDASAEVDLSSCDREPIHIPGSIQPHGVLLVLSEPALVVNQASANLKAVLGVAVRDVLGRPLKGLIAPASVVAVREALTGDRWAELNPLRIEADGRRFDGILHRYRGATILELEPASSDTPAGTLHHPLRGALHRLHQVRTLQELADALVREVRRLTGFERVLLYRFDPDGHGSVDAEVVEAGLEPYLGLRYPASDIPRQARRLYEQSWLRIIPDRTYRPAAILPALRPDTGAPLDLSLSVLRSVSPIHLEYMANMGVRASMSISLVVRGRLWGLISCAHHSGPRHVPYALRSACEVLGRAASLQITAMEEMEATAQRAAREPIRERLAAALQGVDLEEDVLLALLEHPVDLLSLVNATGVAVVRRGAVEARGEVPEEATLVRLARWLDDRAEGGLFSTASLASQLPEAAAVKDVASGLLTFALPGGRRLMWFRPEVVQTVHWGGDPDKPVEPAPGTRLHPRRSFAAWRQELQQQAERWSPSDLEAAEVLRRETVEVEVGRQLVRAQRAVRTRDDLVAVVSHDLRNPLSVARMQVALLKRLLPMGVSATAHLGPALDRIERSLDQMNALIHNLLDLSRIEAGRFVLQPEQVRVRELLDDGLRLLRPLAEAKRVALLDEVVGDPTLSVDRERIFQVLSNLVGNAIKFTPEGGTIEVRAEQTQQGLCLSVCDTGPGLSPEQRERVFERYWQTPETKGERGPAAGTGLGLFIARGIVEAHGGRLWAEEAPGGGARFVFVVPME